MLVGLVNVSTPPAYTQLDSLNFDSFEKVENIDLWEGWRRAWVYSRYGVTEKNFHYRLIESWVSRVEMKELK